MSVLSLKPCKNTGLVYFYTMQQVIKHLSRDPQLKKIIKQHGPLEINMRNKIYLRLCASIMSQQLSTRVADVIYGRFLQLFGGKEPTIKQILAVPDEQLRAIGLSYAKLQYIKNVCSFFEANRITDKKLYALREDELMALLIQIKGVGQWTVEMLLMFSLGKEDVFSADDLGIQQAMERLYGIDKSNKKQMRREMLQRAEAWSPYRTYACLYLWRWKDTP